jgi:uncharacterized membrane protein
VADDQSNGEGAAAGGDGQDRSGLARLLNKEILIPAAATAVTAGAAALAASKGPDLKNRMMGGVEEKAEDLGRKGARGAKEEITGGGGGVGGVLGTVASGASKLIPGKGGGGGKQKKTRRLPIQRWTDVAVPVEEAYERWTRFEDYPKFMHRVLKVEEKDDSTVEWEEKIWFSRRQWQAEIVDRRDNDRIVWKTVSGTSHKGLVSFHRLDDNLTRVLVTVDFEPAGMIEKMGSGLRFAKRAVQADLARFKAFAEFDDAGLGYDAKSTRDEEKKQEQEDEQEGGEKRRDEDSGRNGSSNGNSSSADDEEREAERRERDERRKERREALAES